MAHFDVGAAVQTRQQNSGFAGELSVREAAHRLGVSQRVILNGEFPARMVDGQWRVPEAAVCAHLGWRRDGLPSDRSELTVRANFTPGG